MVPAGPKWAVVCVRGPGYETVHLVNAWPARVYRAPPWSGQGGGRHLVASQTTGAAQGRSCPAASLSPTTSNVAGRERKEKKRTEGAEASRRPALLNAASPAPVVRPGHPPLRPWITAFPNHETHINSRSGATSRRSPSSAGTSAGGCDVLRALSRAERRPGIDSVPRSQVVRRCCAEIVALRAPVRSL